MSQINCTTKEITKLTDQIHRIRLRATEGDLFEFNGGQYLFLIMPDGNRVPLSIASAPEQRDYIELHIRLMAEGGLVSEMLALFTSGVVFPIDGPHGRCFLDEGDNDVVIIAGGTGFSPMKSMVESALNRGIKRNFSLYLGAQKAQEIYQTELIAELLNEHKNFQFIPVVGEPDEQWQGEVGFPHQVALKHLDEKASNCEYFISGSEAMVLNVYKALKDAGVKAEQVHSDILDIKRDMGEVL